ncbi:MAG: carboxylating nicotinate-nucleotide diphosphorylase [Desulfatirhabdiaceae bacterium]
MMGYVEKLIELALAEDIGTGDITTDYLIDPVQTGRAVIRAKESLVLAGVGVAQQVFEMLDPTVRIAALHSDGTALERGTSILEIEGKLRCLLTGERTALNFMQRLSGIATHVRSYVNTMKSLPIRLVDTRKTTPGLRTLEKYAVRMGGAANHRMGLFDGVLIKDNHIAACGGILQAVARMRKHVSHLMKIEVEASNLEEVQDALEAGADVIMLDSMNGDQIREAATLIDGKAMIEVSGRVSQDTIVRLAQSGVNIISVGALTHGAKSVDISMDIVMTFPEITLPAVE